MRSFSSLDLPAGEHAWAGDVALRLVVLDLGVGEGHRDQFAKFPVNRTQK